MSASRMATCKGALLSRLLELAVLLSELGPALFHRLLRGSDGGLVRCDGLDLCRGGRLVLVVVRPRDLLLVEESLVPGKVGLVPLVDGLRLLQLGHCAVEVMLRRGERGLGATPRPALSSEIVLVADARDG